MHVTGTNNYFEDFQVGDIYKHTRGKTVTEMDNVLLAQLCLNTAQPHYNKEYMKEMMGGAFPERLVFGPYTYSLAIGLSSQDISENAVADVGLYNIRMFTPVFHGDTLFAESEILETKDAKDRSDVGIIRYRFRGKKADGTVVVEGERAVLVKKRAFFEVKQPGD